MKGAVVSEQDLLLLLHDWTIVGEYDGGYVIGRCEICGLEDLLDLPGAVV